MKHFATPEFWFHDRQLPPEVRALADKGLEMLQKHPRHPSPRLKKVGAFWSARVGLRVRALAKERAEGLVGFGIGPHDRYDQLVSRQTASIKLDGYP